MELSKTLVTTDHILKEPIHMKYPKLGHLQRKKISGFLQLGWDWGLKKKKEGSDSQSIQGFFLRWWACSKFECCDGARICESKKNPSNSLLEMGDRTVCELFLNKAVETRQNKTKKLSECLRTDLKRYLKGQLVCISLKKQKTTTKKTPTTPKNNPNANCSTSSQFLLY